MSKRILLTPAPPGFKVNPPKITAAGSCPMCHGLAVVRIGKDFRCNGCGHQWGKMELLQSPSRNDLVNGWQAPKLKTVLEQQRKLRGVPERIR